MHTLRTLTLLVRHEMKRHVITLCFLDGSEPFIVESHLTEIQIKHKIDTHIKSKTWDSDLCVDLGIDSTGEPQKLLVPSDTQCVQVQELESWIQSKLIVNYFKE